MPKRPRIYLDNAATSWPKPQAVYDAVDDYQRRLGVAVGRGGYAEAEEVGKAVEETRAAVSRLIGAECPERVVFTFNGTDSLNLAIHGVLRPGDHVVTTVVEHNSVLRPLRWLEDRGQVEVTRVGCDASGFVDPDDIRQAFRPETKLVVLIHASNAIGTIQPAVEIGQIAKERGALFLLDAAQSLGHLPVSVQECGVDLLAAPGHKGLLGPLGTGILYIREGREEVVECHRHGGTGTASFDDRQPLSLPEKYESGNHNAPGLFGLRAGIEYVTHTLGIDQVREHATALAGRLLDGLAAVPRVTVYGPRERSERIGVVSFSIEGMKSPQVAALLDRQFGVQSRAGFQCAALLHRAVGSFETGGAVRFSLGPYNTENEIDEAIGAVNHIAKGETRQTSLRVRCPCVERPETSPSAAYGVLAAQLPAGGMRLTDAGAVPSIEDSVSGLKELWEQTLGDPEITIAVLDGPVDLSHPSLNASSLTLLGMRLG